MTAVDEGTEGRQFPSAPEAAQSNAEMRARARGDTKLPPPIALDAITRGGRWVAARLLDRPASRDGGRPGFAQAREWHHTCAGYYGTPLLRWLRLAWGYAHLLLVKSVTDFTDWFTESPARFFVTVAVILVFWYGR